MEIQMLVPFVFSLYVIFVLLSKLVFPMYALSIAYCNRAPCGGRRMYHTEAKKRGWLESIC